MYYVKIEHQSLRPALSFARFLDNIHLFVQLKNNIKGKSLILFSRKFSRVTDVDSRIFTAVLKFGLQ